MAQGEADFPLQFSVDYPDRDLNRLTTACRIFTVIPIAIVLATISGGPDFSWAERDATYAGGLSAGGVLFLAPLLMIVFRQKYPRWWFDWNLNWSALRTELGPISSCCATSIHQQMKSRRSAWISRIPTHAMISTAGFRS